MICQKCRKRYSFLIVFRTELPQQLQPCKVNNFEIEGDEYKSLSNYVRKVVFTLHESFKEYIMEVDKPPFSIVRNGWGEFDIKISIYFQDINEEPIVKIHNIQIFHNNQNQKATIKKPVVNETYDEIVFVDPTEFFYHMLTESDGQGEPAVDSGELDVKEEGKDEEMEDEDAFNENEADKYLAPEAGKNSC